MSSNEMSPEKWRVHYADDDGLPTWVAAASEGKAKMLARRLGGFVSVLAPVPMAPFAAKSEPVTIGDEDGLRRAIQGVLWNASNYPAKVTPHMLGQDVGPLTKKVTDAVIAHLAAQPVTGTVETEAVKTTRQLHELCQTTALSMDQALHASGLVQRLIDAEQERDAALAVIATVQGDMHVVQMTSDPNDSGAYVLGRDAEKALAVSPPDALDAVKAAAWDEGHEQGYDSGLYAVDDDEPETVETRSLAKNPHRKENPNE